MNGYFRKFLREESGVVESTLVLIPLIILFLISAELIVAVNYRNLNLAHAQGEATLGAITSAISPSDEVIDLSASGSLEKLRLLITHKKSSLPNLLPTLPFLHGEAGRQSDVIGIALIEQNP